MSKRLLQWDNEVRAHKIENLHSGDLTGGPPSMSVTVYTKHVHVMFNQQTVSSLQTLGSLNENELPKKCRFSKNSVLNLQTTHESSLRLGVLSRTLSYMER